MSRKAAALRLGLRGGSAGSWRAPWRNRAVALAGLLFAAALEPACAPAAPVASSRPALVTLSIIGTNDLHGGILSRDGRGGLALLGGYVRNLRAARTRDGGAVLLIDAGDMFQGTLESNLTEGAVVVQAYNELGYAAVAIGNHEFDFGPAGPATTPQAPGDDARGALKARAAEARFPLLAANVIDASTGRLITWPNVQPSVLVRKAGVPVGIVGVITEGGLTATAAPNVAGLRLAPLVPSIVREASRLRAEGARVVVVAAHAGATCRAFDDPHDLSSCEQGAEIIQVARALPRGLVDVIVAGHVHAGIAHVVGEIAIVAAYAGGRAFGRVDVYVDRATGAVAGRQVFPPRDLCARVVAGTGACALESAGVPGLPATYEGAVVEPDSAVGAIVAAAHAAAEEVKARAIGVVLETPVRRLTRGDSPLGNLFTDALLSAVPDADAALHNTTGGLRVDLRPGPLTYGDLYEVMPFENRVVTVTLTGGELRTVIARHIQRTSRILSVAGVHVRARCEGHGLVVTLVRPSGEPIRDDERLLVVLGDFLATGGDDILTPVMPPGGFPSTGEGPLTRDVLADYLSGRGGVLRERDLIDPANPRMTLPGGLPVKCGER